MKYVIALAAIVAATLIVLALVNNAADERILCRDDFGTPSGNLFYTSGCTYEEVTQ